MVVVTIDCHLFSTCTEVEKSEVDIKNGILISLLKFFPGIVVGRDKTFVMAKMMLGRRCAGGLSLFA